MMNHHDIVNATVQNATVERRSLLKLLSASPLLWGASSLLAAPRDPQDPQDPATDKRPAWFLAALRQARTRPAPVVAVVVPDVRKQETQTKALKKQKAEFQKRLRSLCKTASQRAWFTIRFEDRMTRLAVYLQLLLDSQDPAMQELLLEAVWVCAPARLLGAEESETVVTLDSKGRRTGGTILDLSNESEVVARLQHLLHGNTKLQKRAQATRTKEITAAIQDLLSDNAATRSKGRDLLLKDLHGAIPSIIEARHGHRDGALRRALGGIIATAHERARGSDYRGLLPFGTRLHHQSVYDPCPPCGMAKVPEGTRKMLKLLGK